MKFLRILAKIIAVIVIVIALGIGVVYLWSEQILNRVYEIPPSAYVVAKDSISLAQGKRLMTIYHCDGCHGKALTGHIFLQVENVATVVAPNLTKVIKDYTDEDMEHIVRHGIFKNGKASWMLASSSLYFMTDDDLGKIVGYLRTIPEREDSTKEETSIGILGRVGIVAGKFLPPVMVIDHNAKRLARVSESQIGQYLAQSLCSGCHGAKYQGSPDGAPSLLRVKTYSKDQFLRLMKTGEGVTRKNLPLMSEICINHFSYLTESEITAIHDFFEYHDFNK